MPLLNTATRYGALQRTLHWLTALVVLSAFPLGLIANGAATATDDQIARAVALFSAHKTLGITALALGLLRLALRVAQPQPGPLHPDRRLETVLAATAHWTLTLGLIAVPLTGWLSHSATPGLAPILLPVPQSLPGIPASAGLAEVYGALHWLATKVLGLAILLHIAGALKHALLDRDATLARMTRGTAAGHPLLASRRPAIAALALWALTLATGTLLGLAASRGTTDDLRDWTVTAATVTILDATGREIATTGSVSLTLALPARPDSRTPGFFDLSLLLDALDPEAAARLMTETPFPLILFTGTASGDRISGQIDWGGSLAEATFNAARTGDQIRITGEAALPQSAHILALDMTATR